MNATIDEAPLLSGAAQWTGQLPLFSTLRFRLIISVALVHVVLMGAFIWDAVSEQSDSIRAELSSRGHALSSLMSVATTNALLAEDLASLAEVIGRVKRQPDVSYGEVVDSQGNVLASTDAGRIGHRVVPRVAASETMPLRPGDRVLDLREDIKVAGHTVGSVFLGMSTEDLDRELRATRNEGILFILLALLIGSLAAWALSFATTRNLHAVITAVRRITGGDLDVRVSTAGKDEAGVLARAFNTMVESLQRTSHEAKLEHEKRTEAERLACVGELSASIAHEIRNPLAAIINSVKLLTRGDLGGADREQVANIINTESQRLQRTLNDFLTFSRIPESKLARHDLAALVRDTVTLLSNDPTLPSGIDIRTKLPSSPCWGRFDPDQMRQVVLNLLMNAIQAMARGGVLSLGIERSGERLRVFVCDSGDGIPEEMLSKVLRPFVTGRSNGTGLGLSIVQRVLMQHHSTLNIVSHRHVGTEASFEVEAA